MQPDRANKMVVEPRLSLLAFPTYEDVMSYIRELLRGSSLKEVSSKLGFRSPSSASMFLNGKRPFTQKSVEGLSSLLRLNAEETAYLSSLALSRMSGSAPSEMAMRMHNPGVDTQELNSAEFSLLSAWYIGPLFGILSTMRRLPKLEWLEKKLRGKVRPPELLKAITRLEKVNFLRRNGRGIEINSATKLHFKSQHSSDEIRSYHRQMIARALEAVDEQKMTERVLGGTLFNMDPARVPEAAAMLERFREEFRRTFHNDQSTEICQLNFQFFWHTDLN